jgi:LacI family transcriptional regulator
MGNYMYESGVDLSRELIEQNRIDGLFVANLDMGMGAFQVIKEKNISVPDRMGFAMFDDPVWTTLVKPQVSAVRQPVYELGAKAAELLFNRIMDENTESESVEVILEAQLIKRESV